MLELTSLPAKQGDAIWIRWGEPEDLHQIIIDMGTGPIGEIIRGELTARDTSEQAIDLLVITHVDADHIGGVLTCLAEAEPIPNLRIDDVWFNGFEHLNGNTVATSENSLEPLGPVHGEKLSIWLREQQWNKAFNGGPVSRVPSEPVKTVVLHDGLKLSILGPTPDRLSNFVSTWKDAVEEAIEKGRLDGSSVSQGLEALGSDDPPILVSKDDLRILAESNHGSDNSKANGSSITLLLEYKGRKMILSGDAFSDDIVDGINAVSPTTRLHVDLFKLPHHGSKKNVHKELLEAVDCDNWLISTDGTRFKHPDAEAIARVIHFSRTDEPLLLFNVPSKFNKWWENNDWKNLYGYDVEYGKVGTGLILEFMLDD